MKALVVLCLLVQVVWPSESLQECNNQEDCGSANEWICQDRKCYPIKENNEPCDISEQCRDKLVCSNQVCACEKGFSFTDGSGCVKIDKSCSEHDDCGPIDEWICYKRRCYPYKDINESCDISEQCSLNLICINEKCGCADGFAYDPKSRNCFETDAEKLKKKHAEEDAERTSWQRKLNIIWISAITFGVLTLFAVIIIRYRIRKRKVRLSIQERRRSVIEQSRSPSITIPMTSANVPKRKFSKHYAERF